MKAAAQKSTGEGSGGLESALDLLACPACQGALAPAGAVILCRSCGRSYPVEYGIPVLILERAARAQD